MTDKIKNTNQLRTLLGKFQDGTFSEFLDDWRWILSYSKGYHKEIALYLLLGVLSTTLGLVSSVAGKYLIDIIVGRKVDQLWILILVTVFSTVFSLIFSGAISRLSLKISIDVGNDIRSDVFARMIDADWQKLSQFANGDLLNRFNSDVSTVASNAVSWGPSVIISAYHFVATFCVILYYDVTMAWIALASAPFLLIMSRYYMRKNQQYRQRVLEDNSKLMSFEAEAFQNIDTIKSFGITDKYGHELKKWQSKSRDSSLDYNLFQIRTGILRKLLATAVTFLAFGYCLYRLWTGAITYGTMTLFLQQRSALSGQFNSIVGIIPGMLNSSVSARRIRELIRLPKEHHDPENAEKLKSTMAEGLSVRMKNVNFSYAEGNHVISSGDFIANPGEIVALVGPSGEGKTTMLRLILGLVTPQEGNVVLSAANGTEMDMNADVRQFFSYVPQGNTILSGTIADNLRMVKEDAGEDELVDALKTACAWDFVAANPLGIHMNVGEGGLGLSEGQAQRIAIARAVLREAPIMLLDEATSALDSATERQVLDNIIQHHPNKTCIVTTHRPSVLNMCQRIYRVKQTGVRELTEEEFGRLEMEF